ncbi:AP-5 complex subunit beta-1-like isoform X1 [Dysidea avara]|uniref:AP-5 complex subunit beta-1-like isoform X1 n=2 Tax=Dysidea avara TaxID=196820 RepID=UPI0033177CC1
MMDHLNLATPPVMVHTVRMLLRAVQLSGISAMTFKSFLMRYSSSQELMLFYILFLLKVLFGSELCNASEDELILKRNIIIATHPSLSTHHKLVTFNWLLHYPLKQVLSGNRTPIQYSLPYIIDYNDLATLFPTGFDHVDIVAAKLDALSQCFTPGTTNDSSSATLMSCLMGLQKAVYHGVLGPQPVTLYRTLYIYYKRHHNSVLQQDIFRLLITVVMQHPKYTSHTINFIRAVARFQPKSDLPVNLLSALNDQIMSTPMQSVLMNLSYHIVMLETAALYPQLSPLEILKILNKLLSSSNLLSEGNWSLGNSFLSICHKLMQTHNTSLIFKDLCEVLIQISLHYCNIDIRDRALFYRHLLLTVSGDKLSSILSMASSDLASGSASLSQIVEARISDTSYPTTPPVQNISETFLNLTRICGSSKDPVYLLESGNHHHQLGTDSLIEDYLTKLNETSSNPPVVQIHYQLQFVNDIPPAVSVSALEQIFAVSLQFSTISPYSPIPAYHNITVSITPKEPVPTKLHVNAVFTSNEGQTCATKLGCLDIRFEDLFQPVPTDLVSDMDVFFKKMWAHIRNNEYSKSSPNQQGAASVIRLKADSVRTKEVYKELSMFTTNKNSNGLNHFLIFLPPKYHLLLQLEHHSEDQSVVVSIATDYWKILPLVNNYFRT